MQTATNPQTGEKLVLQNGQWVPAGSAAPAAPASPAPMIVGTPRPPKPREPQIRTVGDQVISIDPESGQATPVYTAPPKPEKQKEASDKDAARAGNLDALVGQIRRVDELYRKGFRDEANGIISSLGEYLPSDKASQFNAASAGLAEQGLAAFRVPGMGAQSDTELRQFVEANKPSSSDRDTAVEEKLLQLKNRVNAARQSMGLEPIVWDAPQEQQQANPLYAELEREYRAQGLEVEYDDQGKPIPVLVGGSVGKPQPGPTANAIANGVGDVVEGAGDLVGLVANPITAGINWAAGTNFNPDFGQNARDVLGLPDNGNPYASSINEAATTALSGAGLARAAGNLVSTGAREIASIIGQEPIRQGVAGAGAGGATEFARQSNLGPLGEAGAGVLGGLTAYGGANAMLRAGGRMFSQPSEIAQIAQRQQVDLLPADVGGPTTRNVTAAAAQTPISAAPIINKAQKGQEQMKAAVGRQANREGVILEADDAGEAVRRGGQAYIQRKTSQASRLYDRAAERAQGVSIKPVGALSVIDEQIARLGQLGETNAPLINSLQKLRNDIQNGVKVSGLRDARTALSQGVYDGKLRSSQEKAIFKSVIEALSQDIDAGLSQAGRNDALNMFRQADKTWRERIEYIDNVLEPVIGNNKSGEAVLAAVESMARGKTGGVSRLAGLMRELPPEEAANVRATIIDRIGRAKPGQQDAEGQAFSSATFLTRWNEMSAKGKAALFGDGDLRRNLNEIAKLSDEMKASSKYANSSNTSGSIWGNVGALGGVATVSPKFAITAGIIQFLSGKALASKALTSWLARVPSNPQALERHAGQLEQIAAREPIIANDIQSVQQFLNSGSYRAAAVSEDQSEDRR